LPLAQNSTTKSPSPKNPRPTKIPFQRFLKKRKQDPTAHIRPLTFSFLTSQQKEYIERAAIKEAAF
jgi:hypothetical protein